MSTGPTLVSEITTLASQDLHSLQLDGAIGGYTIRGDHVGVVIHVYAPVGKEWHEPGRNHEPGRTFDQLMFGETFARGQDVFRLEDLIARAVEGVQNVATQLQFK